MSRLNKLLISKITVTGNNLYLVDNLTKQSATNY